MPPKKNQPKAEPKAKADNVDEAPLQAVILADSYNRRFEVLCHDQPRFLLPLCSTPLLAWTLESLSLSKVRQVFIFCGVHADKIRDYVATSPHRSTLDIQCLSSQNAMSAGDALRELDDMHVLNPENPFILVHSPFVSNCDLSKVIEMHKKRREVDKNFIMTMAVGHGGRPHPESTIMLVHPPSSRLLHYIPHPIVPSQPRASFPAALFLDPFPANIDTYEIWSGTSASSSSNQGGYRDLGIDICEADVPALCTENFDYHDLRRHLLNGVLTSELLGKKIAVHAIGLNDEQGEGKGDPRNGNEGRYAERVRDTRTFGDMTRDILGRWAFPLVPDLNEPGGVQYELRAGNVYVAKETVKLARTTTLNGPLLLGPSCNLQDDTLIFQSTLGANCQVGAHTTVSQSYIFSNVRIGKNCTLKECMVGDGVTIGDDVVVGRGVLLGNGVKLGMGARIPDFARIGRERYRGEDYDSDHEEEEESEEDKDQRLEMLGPDSVGYLWPNEEEEEAPPDSDDEEDDLFEHPRNKRLLQLGRRLSNLSDSDMSLSTLSKASSSPDSSPASMASSASLPDIPSLSLDTGPPPAFYSEASASLARAFEEDHKIENALLELRTLVMGYNAGLDRAREEVVKFFVSRIQTEGGAAAILKSTITVWSRWGPLAVGLAPDLTNIALDTQAYCVNNPAFTPWFGIILRGFYEADVLGEEDLLEWRSLSTAKGEGAKDEEEKQKWAEVYAKGKAYVDVLEQMESDDDDDDDDEEDEDEDEDEEDDDE